MLVALSGLYASGEKEDSLEIIRFGDYSHDSAQIHNRIVAFIMENGLEEYKADFVPGDTLPIINGLRMGDIDLVMESWHNNIPEIYKKGIESGSFVDLGRNMPDAPQGWYVPRYLVEGPDAQAPDLKHVSDLAKYAHLFPDPEDPSKGLIYGGVAGWNQVKRSLEIFDENNLSDTFNIAIIGSGIPIAATMDAAYTRREPWVGYYWEPTAILGRLDMVRLKGSEWPPSLINILVHSSLLERAPEVIEILKKYETSVKDNSEALKAMDENDLSAQEAAVWFLKNKEEVWTQWVSNDVADKVKKALVEL